jgi:hypothetical protein
MAAQVQSASEATRLHLTFPAEGVHAELTLDVRGCIVLETLSDPKHLFKLY